MSSIDKPSGSEESRPEQTRRAEERPFPGQRADRPRPEPRPTDDRSPAELRREMRAYATPRDYAEAKEREKEAAARQSAAKETSAGTAREGTAGSGGAAEREAAGARGTAGRAGDAATGSAALPRGGVWPREGAGARGGTWPREGGWPREDGRGGGADTAGGRGFDNVRRLFPGQRYDRPKPEPREVDNRSPAELRREMRAYATPRDYAEAKEREKEAAARQSAAKETSAGTAREGASGWASAAERDRAAERDSATDRERDGAGDRERDGAGTRAQAEGQEPRRDAATERRPGEAAAEAGALQAAEGAAGRDTAEQEAADRDTTGWDRAPEAGPGAADRTGPDGAYGPPDRRDPGAGVLTEAASQGEVGRDTASRDAVRETATGPRADDARDYGDWPEPDGTPGRDRPRSPDERAPEAIAQRERAGAIRTDASTDEAAELRKRIAQQDAEIAGLKDGMAKILAKLDKLETGKPEELERGDQPSAAIGRNEREETSPEKEAVTRAKTERRWRLPSDAANNVLGTITAGAVTDLTYHFSGLSPEVAGVGATGVTAVAGGIAWWRERKKRKHDGDH